MNIIADYESKLWDILVKEHLADLSQFHKPRFSDEVPLFSRESDIAFLSEYPDDRTNAILLNFGLKFLKSVVSYEEHRAPYFAAITVWSFSESDPIIPNLFVWSGPIQRLEKKLALNEATTPFGKRIKGLVSKLGLRKRFDVLDDISTVEDMERVFISQLAQPYPSVVPLARFRKPIHPAKQRVGKK
jgi:hypothetical protein